MSHQTGAVRFPDGTINLFEYNGTVDICIPMLWDKREELSAHWRSGQWRDCLCGPAAKIEPVEIYANYGGGYYWPGTACRTCNTLVSGHEPAGEENGEKDGEPEWWLEWVEQQKAGES